MNFQNIQLLLEGETTVNNLNCLVKLGVAGVVSLLAACGGEVSQEITKLPATEIKKSAPEGIVTVGESEQIIDHTVRCELGPYEATFCGYAWITNTDGFPVTFVIEESKFATAK